MERLSFSLEKKKKLTQGPQLANQYSYLNLKRENQDQINLFNVELEKLKKKDFALPSITTQRNKIIIGIAQKLSLIKNRLKERETTGNNRVCNSIYSDRISPIPINYPFPIQQPIPPPMPFPPYPYPYPQPQPICCPQCHHKKPKKNKKKKKQKKQKKQQQPKQQIPIPTKKRNKFRIYAYAIYFCIFFPCYSKKFTVNRKKWFDDRYNRTQKGIIYQGSQQILKKLQQIDFYQLSLDSKINKHITGGESPMIDWQDYTKTALVPNATFHKTSSNSQSTSQYLINLTQILLSKLGQIVMQQEFVKEYHEVFSAGSLDLSFMIDNLYLPQETPFLFVHPVKGYLRLNQQEEIQLLLVKVFVKMFIFNFLLGLYRVKSWNKRLESTHKLAQYQIQEVWEVTRTVAIYLYIICKEMYIQGVQNLNHKSNFYEFCKKFGIRQAKHLEEVIIIQNEEGVKKEKPFQLIRNMRNYEITYEKLTKNKRLMEYKSVIKQKIVDLLSNLHQKLKNEERQFFNYIKNMTLAVPFLILNSIAKQKQQLVKKQRQLKILKPNEKSGKAWHQLYSNNSYLNNSFQSQNSKTKKIKFEGQLSRNQSSLRLTKGANLNSMNISRVNGEDSNAISVHDNKENQTKQVLKSNQMKKAFNIDTVNAKFDQNRQDRLRQKFRNYLGK